MYKDTIQFKAWITDEVERQRTSIELGDKCERYYEGDQLPDEVKIIIEQREQPEQWENNMAKVGKKIQGYMINRNTEIKVTETRRKDKSTARIVQELLRNIANHSEYKSEKRDSDKELQNRGIGVQEVFVKERSEKDSQGNTYKDVFIKNIPAGECVVDSYATENDNSNARYFHRLFYVDSEDLYMFFDDKKVDNIKVLGNWSEEALFDREYEGDRNEVLLAETWYRKYNKTTKKNEYFFCFWVDDVILMQAQSPYEFEGFPFAIEYVNRNKKTGAYWGLFKDIIPIQDSINFAKIRLHNMLGSVKLLLGPNAVEDVDEFKEEFNEDDAAVEVQDPNKIREINQNSKVASLLQVIRDGREQIKELIGANDEFLAMANNRLSGEAIGKRLEIGIAGLSDYIMASENLQKRSMKLCVKMIPQYYDANRQVDIVGEETVLEYNIPKRDNYGIAQYEIKDGWKIPVVEHNLRDGSYRLTYTTQMQPMSSARERYAQNIEVVKLVREVDPEAAYEIMPEVIMDSDSPRGEQIAKKLQARLDARQNQKPSEETIQKLQLENEAMRAKVDKLQAEANFSNARAQKLGVDARLSIEELMSQG